MSHAIRWLLMAVLLVSCKFGVCGPLEDGFEQRYLWTWDHRMDWSGKTPGRTPMGGGGKYHKAPGEYLEDYKNLVDYMAEKTSFNAVIIWGFLRDFHGGVQAGQELCRYANERGIRIIPGVGTSGYEGYYFEGDHEYNITTRLEKHPEFRAVTKDGKTHKALCPSRPENVQWLMDGCRWLFETFDIGGINFEIGDFFVCYCDHCKQARAAIPGDAPDYYKDMAISTAPVAKLAHELAPDAWLSYATYTGFTAEMAETKPDWVDLIPEEIHCQWTLTGMGSDERWPPGLAPPTKLNTGYLHWGNKSTASIDRIFLRQTQYICRRAAEANFAGLATYGEDPPGRYSMKVFYDAWSYFLDHPSASLEDYADERLAKWVGSEADGRKLLALLLELEQRGINRSALPACLESAREAVTAAPDERGKAAWGELVSFLEDRLAEIEAQDVVIEDPAEASKAMQDGFRVKQDSSTTLVLPKQEAETLELLVRVDYSQENGILPVMRVTLNGESLGPDRAIDRPERIRTPKHDGYPSLEAFDADEGAWRVKYDTDFTLNNWPDRKYDTEDYDPVFRFRVGDLWNEGENRLRIDNFEARFRPTDRGVLVVGHIGLE